MDQDPNAPKRPPFVDHPTIHQPNSACDNWLRQAGNPRETRSARLAAIDALAGQCRIHRVFQTLGWLFDNPAEDLEVRRAAVRAPSAWEESAVPVTTVLVRALSLPGVRPVAIEALHRIGPASGAKESRLLAALASLRSGGPRSVDVPSLAKLYGRDPRLLAYLRESLRTGNRWQRAIAASTLLGLGEVEPALEAARDPDRASARASLPPSPGMARNAARPCSNGWPRRRPPASTGGRFSKSSANSA